MRENMPGRARAQTCAAAREVARVGLADSRQPPYAQAVAAYELELRETTVEGFALAEVTGELDLTNAGDLEKRLERNVVDAPGLVIDLNKVTFLDSAALHVLFRLGRELKDAGKDYGVVLAPSAPVAKTVEMVRLEEAARIGPTLEDVLSGLRS
jgi:anti-anti-sigma factor